MTIPAANEEAAQLRGTIAHMREQMDALKAAEKQGADFRKISGTLVGTMEDTRIALDYAKRGLLKQICEVYPIDKLPEAVDRLRKGQVAGRMVVDFNM